MAVFTKYCLAYEVKEAEMGRDVACMLETKI
jgi:hypothetical protein